MHIDGTSSTLPTSHPSFLLIYNLIPTELSSFFYNYIGNQKVRSKIFLQFMTGLMQHINQQIWRNYQNNVTQWETSLNITPKQKRKYCISYTTPRSHPNVDNALSTETMNTDHINNYRRKRKRRIYEDLSIAHLNRNHISSRLYYKKDSLITQDQHIRWTSSNFLHSGSWESHNDTILFHDHIDIFSFSSFSNISHLLPHR
jgi:hypothetical protein